MREILEVKDLSKTYKDFALRNVSFSLEKGYIMGFIGPNGAGKSTTIRLIMNLIKKSGGIIKIFGLDHQAREIEIKNRLGFVYDENVFYEELTIQEMKGIVAPFYQRWDEKLFKSYLNRFSLDPKKKIKELSRGMRMKFALAIALSHHADLIIMDEPTSGLDPIVRSELLEILAEYIQDEEKAVFLSTHLTTDLDKIADYITFIHEGQILLSQAKDQLLDTYAVVKGAKKDLTPNLKENLIGIKTSSFGFEKIKFHLNEKELKQFARINKRRSQGLYKRRIFIRRCILIRSVNYPM
jgi:ABC-2 type transport system ATP-binding protein